MSLFKSTKDFQLDKRTFVNLRWIAYTGQVAAIFIVQFFFKFNFNYLTCLSVISLSILTNLYLQFKTKENQLSNLTSTAYLAYDIFQLGCLLFLTGGITNPFIILILVPTVFSAQYLNKWSSILLALLTLLVLTIITFYYYDLPHPEDYYFDIPNYYLYSIPISVFIGLVFLVYFGVKFGNESRIRKEAYAKIQEIMAKENELVSLGGQAAAAAHSLGTPLSTIFLIVEDLKEELGDNKKIAKDLDLLISQTNRCKEILKKLSLNPHVEDEFLDSEVAFKDYIIEIVRSFEEISKKNFLLNFNEDKNPIKTYKSSEIIYGLRNFIGNANKFCKENVEIFLKSEQKKTIITIKDDGPGFPKDLIDKHMLGEPYIRTNLSADISKNGLGLGTFIGKTLLEKNFANIEFKNFINKNGAIVTITWLNSDLKNI